MTELFSVSMCVYGKDHPEWFKTAVESILNQSVKPTEIILVVDGPVPENLKYTICAYESVPGFRVIWLPENVGHGNARRIGLENCTYDLVALMDADDISVSDRFEKQLRAFERNPALSVLGGIISEFCENPENIVGYRSVPESHEDIRTYIKKRCPLNQVSVMFRKSDIMQAGGYQDWYNNEDYYLWLRMFMKNMVFGNIPEVLVNVRVGKEMYRRRGGWKYFVSEWKLQNYMLRKRIIGPAMYLLNVSKRFVVQVLLPNKLRGWVFQKFAREKG